MPTETVLKSNDIETVAPARVGDTLGYARVSTHDQNPDAQSDRLIEAGAIRVFTDIVSGKRFDRPALAELIDHARPGDRLCIIRLDRLGRSLRELLETVDGLKARGIHLISLEERLDTSSAADELVFHVFGSIAHFERRLISERKGINILITLVAVGVALAGIRAGSAGALARRVRRGCRRRAGRAAGAYVVLGPAAAGHHGEQIPPASRAICDGVRVDSGRGIPDGFHERGSEVLVAAGDAGEDHLGVRVGEVRGDADGVAGGDGDEPL